MKITKLECIPLIYTMNKPFYSGSGKCGMRQLLIVRVYTDEGVTGIGEAATFGGPVSSTLQVLVDEIEPMLLGEDPFNVERIWRKCYLSSFQHGRGGIFISALSGVDIALWDIIGKSTGQPLYKLLGGFRDSIPVYASGGFYMQGKTIDDLSAEAASYADSGFRGVKIKVARTDSSGMLLSEDKKSQECIVSFDEDLERVQAVKKALGKNLRLMVDANAAWGYNDALKAGKLYDELDVYFFEEPVRTDDYEGSARLSHDLQTRIAGYETEALAVNYTRLITMGAVDIVQPDLSWSGGITESRKIAALAAARHMECAAHVFSSGILLVASLHFTCGIPNGTMMEYDMSDNLFRTELLTEPIVPDSAGNITVSKKPGLGIELNEAILEKYRIDTN